MSQNSALPCFIRSPLRLSALDWCEELVVVVEDSREEKEARGTHVADRGEAHLPSRSIPQFWKQPLWSNQWHAENMTTPTTIDEYIAAFPPPAQRQLSEIRELCRAAAPTADEQLKWRHPAYVHTDGVILFMFSGHAKHASLAFTPSTRAAFADDLTDYQTGKGTVALPYGTAVPVDLVRRMLEYRVLEYELHGVKWM